MKTCIRCWNTEKDIRKNWMKTCYVGWGSYPRHDYSKPLPLSKDWLLLLEKKIWRRKRDNTMLDTKIKEAIELLTHSKYKVSYRNIAKLIHKENSLRSIQLSVKRQGISL